MLCRARAWLGGRLTAAGVRAQPPFLFYYRASNDEVEKGVVDLLGATVKLPAASEQIRVSVARGRAGGRAAVHSLTDRRCRSRFRSKSTR